MRHAAARLVCAGAFALGAGGTHAQPNVHAAPAHVASDSVARFLARAKDATARYRDRSAAVADGYVRQGPDFPGMGEHWFNIRIVFARALDAAHPGVLEYASIDGRPTLIGVAYALPLVASETSPDFPAVDAWHAHVGTVDEESQLLGQAHEHAGGAGAPRLVMLHLWVWLENPAGPWAADNWALPFARAGMPVTTDVGADAGRAMSLGNGGDAYYAALFEREAAQTADDSAATRDGVARAREQVLAWIRANAGRTASEAELAELRAIWRGLLPALEAHVSPTARARLRDMDHSLQEGTER
jgi:hypothetical protein